MTLIEISYYMRVHVPVSRTYGTNKARLNYVYPLSNDSDIQTLPLTYSQKRTIK